MNERGKEQKETKKGTGKMSEEEGREGFSGEWTHASGRQWHSGQN